VLKGQEPCRPNKEANAVTLKLLNNMAERFHILTANQGTDEEWGTKEQ
jgi:hypothetical protein